MGKMVGGEGKEDMERMETASDVTKTTAGKTTGREEGTVNPQLLSAREWLQIQREEWEEFKLEAKERQEREREKRKEEAELKRAQNREIKTREREERKRQKRGGGGR